MPCWICWASDERKARETLDAVGLEGQGKISEQLEVNSKSRHCQSLGKGLV
jgi:hypothetical protein